MDFLQLGKRIRNCRKGIGMSQATLAELTGVSVNYIGLIEHADRQTGLDLLEKIAAVLDTTVISLLFEVNTADSMSREIDLILQGCTNTELLVIKDMILALKSAIRCYYTEPEVIG